MDVGGATGWSMDQVVSQREILELDGAAVRAGRADPRERSGRRPSGSRWPDGTVFGVIASTTAPFCRTCDRGRLTADGTFLLCLYGETGLDLRELLRGGADRRGDLAEQHRRRSGARGPTAAPRSGRSSPERGVLHRIESLRADPRREMHTRGG